MVMYKRKSEPHILYASLTMLTQLTAQNADNVKFSVIDRESYFTTLVYTARYFEFA